ncbi:hypothetical protein BT93_L3874 [Corymbia citriodora subsp. variegata]|uniref:Uncharacterized protein n=1 Tax=Corymbia citriodora subsp. variegata TaxID=360336 RepID=A0A8T0CYM5_CORYI|nr:hypothetical protein BT93_L3874 [Corymbia citriodora subsp. variegata]
MKKSTYINKNYLAIPLGLAGLCNDQGLLLDFDSKSHTDGLLCHWDNFFGLFSRTSWARSLRFCYLFGPIIVLESFYHIIDLGLANMAKEIQIQCRRQIKMRQRDFAKRLRASLCDDLEEACGPTKIS